MAQYQPWLDTSTDPTIQLLVPNNRLDNLSLPNPLVTVSNFDTQIKEGNSPVDTSLVNVTNLKTLQTMESYLSLSCGLKILQSANPFKAISKSLFVDNSGIEIANLDALYNFSQTRGGLLAPLSPDPIVYCLLGGAPGGVGQYMQYRLPNSFGYAMSLTSEQGGRPWDHNHLDKRVLRITDGEDGTGDLISNADWMAHWIKNDATISGNVTPAKLRKDNLGVDIVIGLAYLDRTDDLSRERDNFKLLVAQSLTALQVLWPDGTMILKCVGANTRATADLIIILSRHFEKVNMMQPLTMDPSSDKFYLICQKFVKQPIVDSTVNLLREIHEKQRLGHSVAKLLMVPSPETDLSIKHYNNLFLQRRLLVLQIVKDVILLIENGQKEQAQKVLNKFVPRFNLYKTSIFWNLPS